MSKSFVATTVAATGLSLLMVASSLASQINTGGRTGAYFGRFCPELKTALKKSAFDYECALSKGSRENLQRVVSDPTQIGYSQFDVFALEKTILGGENLFTTIRADLGNECLFMVTKNRQITNFGEVAALAASLRFILPPEKSGSAATFEFLQQIDPNGLGLATSVSHAASTDEAIEQALASNDAVTLFVQFPDPENARFKLIDKLEGHAIPVIDRNILRQQIGGEKVYYAEETEISNPKWLKSSDRVITACTPMVLFTGNSSRVEDSTARRDLDDLVKTVRALKADDLRPKEGFFKRMWRKTKRLSAKSVEGIVDLSEKAREKAAPTLEAAKKKSKELMEKAGPALEAAKEKSKELIEQAGPALETAKEKGKELMEKAGDLAEQAKEKGKELMGKAKDATE